MADPIVIDKIVKAAKKYGVDPRIMLATALTENGAQLVGKPGDGGTSFGAFQWHRGGALGNNSPEWTQTQDAFDERARAFAKYGVKKGKGAAAVQRPKDQAGYAIKVDGNYAEASRLLKLPSGVVSTVPAPAVATSPAVSAPLVQQTTQSASPGGLTVGGLLQRAKEHLGTAKVEAGESFIEQAFKENNNLLTPNLDPLTQAPLPSGAFSSVPVNKLKMSDSAVKDTKLSPSGKGIVDAAVAFKGTPYSWGGGGISGPSKGIGRGKNTTGFDCSGLIQYAVYQATGKKIPRIAQAQLAAAKPVSIMNAKPGDVIGFGTKSNVHHIGIYLGDGKFIASPKTGDVVKISTLADRKDVVGVGRF